MSEAQPKVDPSARDPLASEARPFSEAHVIKVRQGHGANCSSIGSVIDTLFATATVGAALFASVAAAIAREPLRTTRASRPTRANPALSDESTGSKKRDP